MMIMERTVTFAKLFLYKTIKQPTRNIQIVVSSSLIYFPFDRTSWLFPLQLLSCSKTTTHPEELCHHPSRTQPRKLKLFDSTRILRVLCVPLCLEHFEMSISEVHLNNFWLKNEYFSLHSFSRALHHIIWCFAIHEGGRKAARNVASLEETLDFFLCCLHLNSAKRQFALTLFYMLEIKPHRVSFNFQTGRFSVRGYTFGQFYSLLKVHVLFALISYMPFRKRPNSFS